MYVTVKEAIAITGLSQATVYRAIARGKLESKTIVHKRAKNEVLVSVESAYRLRDQKGASKNE